MYSVYPLSEKDLCEVIKIEGEWNPIPWDHGEFLKELNSAHSLAIGIFCGKVLVGYCVCHLVLDEGHIVTFGVMRSVHRKGVGTILLKELIEITSKKGVSRITLEVRRSNLPAQILYQNFGFFQVGTRKAYYASNGEDAITMAREATLTANEGLDQYLNKIRREKKEI